MIKTGVSSQAGQAAEAETLRNFESPEWDSRVNVTSASQYGQVVEILAGQRYPSTDIHFLTRFMGSVFKVGAAS